MSGEAATWLQYARENLKVAEMTLQAGLLNSCLQSAGAEVWRQSELTAYAT